MALLRPLTLRRRGAVMSHATTHGLHRFGVRQRPADLRTRIGWFCQGLRIAALVWIGWILVLTLMTWSDRAVVLKAYGQWLSIDLADVSSARYATAFVLVLVDLAI